MPEEKDDPIGKATAGANWFVGLSGAAVGGALAKLDLIQKFPFWGKFWCIVATTFFLWSIVSGVYYYFQLLVLAQTKEKLERAEAGPNPNQTSIDGAKANRDKANEKVGRFFYGAMTTFAMACIATLIGLCFVFFTPSPAPPPPPLKAAAPTNHYSIINVPVHMGGRLLHSHTFLLDEQSGALWLMVCQADKTVQFRRVKRSRLDGTQEDPAPDSSAAPSPAVAGRN